MIPQSAPMLTRILGLQGVRVFSVEDVFVIPSVLLLLVVTSDQLYFTFICHMIVVCFLLHCNYDCCMFPLAL